MTFQALKDLPSDGRIWPITGFLPSACSKQKSTLNRDVMIRQPAGFDQPFSHIQSLQQQDQEHALSLLF